MAVDYKLVFNVINVKWSYISIDFAKKWKKNIQESFKKLKDIFIFKNKKNVLNDCDVTVFLNFFYLLAFAGTSKDWQSWVDLGFWRCRTRQSVIFQEMFHPLWQKH